MAANPYAPRGLRSNTPYVHVDKDRNNAPIVLKPIKAEKKS